MNTYNVFQEISASDAYHINGGSLFGNALILAGSLVGLTATGPVGIGVGVAIAVIGFCHSNDW